MQLLLTAGHGAMTGPGMTILNPSMKPLDIRFEDVLSSYSGYKPSYQKIRQVLEISGRYDCWVQGGWLYLKYKEVKKDFHDIGLIMKITSVPEHDRKWAFKNGLVIERV